MTEHTIEVEADSLDEARKRVKSQIPQGLQIATEEILSDGATRSVKGVAATPDAASREAESKLPAEAEVVERKVQQATRQVVTVDAFDEPTARIHVEQGLTPPARVEDVALKKPGKKGLFGMGKKPNTYDVHVVQPAVVEIKYTTKALIRVELQESPDVWAQKLENKDYSALTSLQIIEKSDPRFSRKLYDKDHDLFVTPLEAENPYGGSSSLAGPQTRLHDMSQEILTFWRKPQLSYSRSLQVKPEQDPDELRIRRTETFRDLSVTEKIMYVVRLGDDSYFSWTRRAK
jgi:hypothetical protein